MGKKSDGMLQLLQDIKELLLGIGLILTAICVLLLGWVLQELSALDIGSLACLAGLALLVFGIFHVWNGWTAHKVLEQPAENEEEQGGSHVS